MGIKSLALASVVAVSAIATMTVSASAAIMTGVLQLSGISTTDSTDPLSATEISIPLLVDTFNVETLKSSGSFASIPLNTPGNIASTIPLTIGWGEDNFYVIKVGLTTLSFDLTSITAIGRNVGTDTISIKGNGVLHWDGYDATNGVFTLSTQSSGTEEFSFSSSTRATTPAPEPASIALLGAGLAGLGMRRKKRAA